MRKARAALVLALAALTPACTPLDRAMETVFGRSMRDQNSMDPYEMTLLPPDGTVPFAAGNYPAQMGQVDVGQTDGLMTDLPPFTQAAVTPPPGQPVVNDLVNPVAPTEVSLARGDTVFQRFCSVCHGANGISSEALILPKLPIVAVYNLATGNARTYTDGYIFGMMTVGRGMMPAYGGRIAYYDRWNIVNYVRHLQQRADSLGLPLTLTPPPAPSGEED